MLRVEIASTGAGVVLDSHGNALSGQAVVITDANGVTVTPYKESTGTPTVASTTNADGVIPGWLEPGAYTFVVTTTTGTVTTHLAAVPAWTGIIGTVTATALNAAIALAETLVNVGGQLSQGVRIVLQAGDWDLDAPIVYAKGGFLLEGSGKWQTSLRQANGVAAPVIGPSAPAACQPITIRNLALDAFHNSGSNTGGIDLCGAAGSVVEHCYIAGTNNYGVRIRGYGVASSGDAMNCAVRHNSILNLGSGAAHVQLSNGAAGGSHPDGAMILGNLFQSAYANATIGVKIDTAITATGADSADACRVLFNNMIEVPTPVVWNTQGSVFMFNRCEVTGSGAGETLTIQETPGPANWTSARNKYGFNQFATYGDPAKLIVADGAGGNLSSTSMWLDHIPGTNSEPLVVAYNAGAFAINLAADIDTNSRVISTYNSTNRPIVQFGATPPASPVNPGSNRGVGQDNDGSVWLNATGGVKVKNSGVDGNVVDNGAGVVFVKNTSAVPGSNPTGGGYLYVDSGALKYRGSGGTVTTLGAA